MSQLIVEELSHSVGAKDLFEHLQFTITNGDKIGLIGVNGTGKSTLLSIVAKKEDADAYRYEHPNNYRIVHLAQEPKLDENLTVLETVFTSDAPLVRLNLAYEHAVQNLTKEPSNETYQKEFERIQNEMDVQGAWDTNATARTILTKLGMDTFDKKVGDLSGGQQKRVALAKALIEPADLLLLDEPTNHLDIEAITWLQEHLKNESSAVVFITHDRYFLDDISTHIFELANKRLYTHSGNYADFIESKAIREEMEKAKESKLQNRYRSELKWIKRGARARSTKQKARIQRFEQLKDDLQKDNVNTDMNVRMQTARLGRKVIEGENLSKSFGEQVIIKDFSFLLRSGDRIAIIGPNGVGKSTLMNIIAEKIPLDTGHMEKGSTVKIAHFEQHIPDMDEHKRMIEYIRESSNDIEDANGERISASQMLERFLFPSHVHGTLIEKLSGGERKRLYLLKLLMEQANVLLLDEPTNDLDLETLGILEDFIDTFPGVVISISHDRFYLDRTSTKLWALDGSGKIVIHDGIYTDYLEEIKIAEMENIKENAVPLVQKKESLSRKSSKKSMTYQERKEWETIEEEIEKLEQEIISIEAQMNEAAANYVKLKELTELLDEKNIQYERLFERWAYLQQLQEQ